MITSPPLPSKNHSRNISQISISSPESNTTLPRMPLDHLTLTVPSKKVDAVVLFLTESLGHMGFKEMMRPVPGLGLVGCGEVAPYFWVNSLEGEEGDEALMKVLGKQHIAFTANSKEQVDLFHAAALKAGAKDNGEPGLREHYHPAYYGAFVIDPVCGINFEVVFHGASGY